MNTYNCREKEECPKEGVLVYSVKRNLSSLNWEQNRQNAIYEFILKTFLRGKPKHEQSLQNRRLYNRIKLVQNIRNANK